MALSFQAGQLFIYAFGRSHTIMWIAGALAAVASISYPAISTLVSTHADVDQQVGLIILMKFFSACILKVTKNK